MTKPLVPGQFWVNFDFSRGVVVLHERVEIIIPSGRAARWRTSEFGPKVSDSGGRQTFAWEGARRNSTPSKEAQEAMAARALRGRLPVADVELSSFENWEAVGAWFGALMKGKTEVTPEIRSRAEKLTKGAKTDEERIAILHAFVATQIRYIGVAFGIGRFQPHSAAEQLENGYGDCKDKHTLLAALLAAVGIQAYPALIGSARELDPDVPSPGQFDHVITVVPRAGVLSWLDTTPEVGPPGFLLLPLRDKQALLIPAGSPARLEKTPADPSTPKLQTFRINATIDDAGTLKGRIERALTGDDVEVLLRAVFRRTPGSKWKELVQLTSFSSGYAGEVSDVSASDPGNLAEPFCLTYTYTRKNFPDWANRRVADALPSLEFPDADETPDHDVWLGPPGSFDYESFLTLPAGSSPQLPPRVDLEEPFAEYHSGRSFADGALRTTRRLTVRDREIPFDLLESYRKFVKAIRDDESERISLDRRVRVTRSNYREAVWDLPESDNPDATRAFDEARASTNGGGPEAFVAALERAVKIDPGFTRAWLLLGDTYKFLRKPAKATEAFRAAVKGDPRARVAYEVLAFHLEDSGKHAEAVDVWRRLVTLAPEDPDAWSGLAEALASDQKEKEAVTALETATRLDPGRAELQVQLGVAFARTGQSAKAKETFERALAGDPSSEVLHSAAASLAGVGRQLALARECAMRAVAREEEEAGKVDLAEAHGR